MDRTQEATLATSVIMLLLYPVTNSLGGAASFSAVILAFGILGLAVGLLSLISHKLKWMLYLWIAGFFIYFIGVLLYAFRVF